MTAPMLDRSRLSARLTEQAAHPQVILLRAPAGFGKTVAIAQWLRQRDEQALWVDCSAATADAFWTYLASRLAPALGAGIPNPDFPLGSVRDLLEGLDRPLTLVLDDYHRVTLPEHDQLLADIAARTPLLTLAVLARRVRVLDGPIVTSRTPVALFGPRELAFAPEETEQLAALLGRAVDEPLRAAFQDAAGWPLATRAALGPVEAGEPGGARGPGGARDPEGSGDGADADTDTGTGTGTGDDAGEHPDPRGELIRFALNHFEIVSDTGRRVLLAASLLDAVSFAQLEDFADAEVVDLRDAVHELLELGVLVAVRSGATTEFACHSAVQGAFALRSERSLSPDQRRRLLGSRAREIEGSAPFTAFKLYCSVGQWPEAESVLARNFTMLTAETPGFLGSLRAVPETALAEHPAFPSALLFLETADAGVPDSAIQHLVELLAAGLRARIADPRSSTTDGVAAAVPPVLRLPALCQYMVLSRLGGDLDAAYRSARDLETRIVSLPDPRGDDAGARMVRTGVGAWAENAGSAHGSAAVYYREIALTALGVGDLDRARRNWQRLLDDADAMIAAPWKGFPRGSTRTVGDPAIGRRWRLAALGGLAFTEMVDGRMRRCAELLEESDRFAVETGESAPASTWVVGDVARSHLAYALDDPELLHEALERLHPISARIEAWPLLLLGESEVVRSQRGSDWALTRLQSGLELHAGPAPSSGAGTWRDCVTHHRAMLSATLGDLSAATATLAAVDPDATATRIERARIALFSLDDTQALLLAQQIGGTDATVRQQTDHTLIAAVAAWGCGLRKEAFEAFATAAALVEQHELGSLLWSLPHDELLELAESARDAGICDLVAAVEAVPAAARCRRYERLTEMELRTLQAVSVHRSISETAESLFVTSATVKKHLNAVYRKLRVRGREEAILQGTRMGLLTAEPA